MSYLECQYVKINRGILTYNFVSHIKNKICMVNDNIDSMRKCIFIIIYHSKTCLIIS